MGYLTHHQHDLTAGDLDTGFDDRTIYDGVQIIGFFHCISRIADALGVEPEDFIEPWGEIRTGA